MTVDKHSQAFAFTKFIRPTAHIVIILPSFSSFELKFVALFIVGGVSRSVDRPEDKTFAPISFLPTHAHMTDDGSLFDAS
jgi:hypothetical protein